MRCFLGVMLVGLTVCGCGGGGSSGGSDPPPSAPAISSLTPTSATVGSAALTLTINGSGFVASSVADWNGAMLQTSFVSATQLKAQVPASDLTAGGTANVTVVNPQASGGTSAPSSFSIANSAKPMITSLAPASAAVGSGAFTLLVNGSNFGLSSSVDWNGAALPTTYISATQIKAQIPASDLNASSMANVTVVNPPSNGGTSAAASFSVTPAQGAGPQLVQWNAYQTTSNNTEVNSTVQFDTPTKAGDTIWVAVTVSDFAGIHAISITDTQGNVYTLLDQVNDGAPGTQTVAHFYASNIAGDAATPDIVTAVWSTDDYKGILVAELSGTTMTPLVGSAKNMQDGLSAGSGNVIAGPINVGAGQTPALLVALSMNTTGGASDTGGSGFGGPAAGGGMTQAAMIWNWGANLATFATAPVSSAESISSAFNAPDADSYVTVAVVFH